MIKNDIFYYLKKLLMSVIVSLIFITIFCFAILDKNPNIPKQNNNWKIPGKFTNKNIHYPLKVKVYITNKRKVIEMDLEDYVKGVVSGEMPVEFNIEALKAQAVAARTYALAHMNIYGGCNCPKATGANLCDTIHCQVFKYKEDRMRDWPKRKKDEYWAKIEQAVNETSREVITYDGKVIKGPYYFSTSSGVTENSEEIFSNAIPYLKSVKSPGEEKCAKFKTKTNYSYKSLLKIINNNYPGSISSYKNLKFNMKIKSRTKGGSVKELKVGNTVLSGVKFRKMFGLNSANFSFNFKNNSVDIICRGYGHGVGMSQFGANALANNGKKYIDILKHYYTGVKITNYQKVDVQQ